MKRNKLAAGALALALGLSAVAPSFADDAKAVELKSTELFQEQYKSLLERTNKERNDYLADKAAYDKAEADLKAAKDTLAKEYAAYEEIINPIAERVDAYNDAVKRATEEYNLHAERKADGKIETIKVPTFTKTDEGKFEVKFEEKEVLVAGEVYDEAKSGHETEFEVAKKRLENAKRDLEAIKGSLASAADQLQRVKAAETARDVAQTNLDKAEAELAKHTAANGELIWVNSLAEVKAASEGYNVTIQATDKGVVIVEKEDDDKEEGISAEQLAKLQASIDKANETLKAVEILKDLTPNTAANNQAKLDALVAEQKAAIARAEAIIKAANKKVALVSTAYAAEEEEVTAEDVDALIKELDDNTAAIQKELKEIDKDVEVEEEKPAEDDKKEDEKPADKEEDKADDKKEDKAEDKKDDKKEDDTKVIEKTKVVEKSANKTAGSNAKTGIAGVAGVAGVLAAASVAYAASKKNN